MKFSQHLKKLAEPIWNAQLKHPFVQALGEGTLPQRKFQFYIIQDSLFLFELAKIFSAAAQKSMDTDTMARFSQLASDTVRVEQSLHKEYGKLWNMTEAEMAALPMAPTNFAYTRHMLHVAETGSLAETAVVTLPCAWIYAEVAEWLRDKIDGWVKNAGADEKLRMESHFVISSRYEWMFWEMAWTEEKWPI